MRTETTKCTFEILSYIYDSTLGHYLTEELESLIILLQYSLSSSNIGTGTTMFVMGRIEWNAFRSDFNPCIPTIRVDL